MSEYQYYEFQAIDRPLTAQQMDYLRGYSSRAEITPTCFVNEYNWGDFRGNEDTWMERYFDALLYFANWGTHRFRLRLPAAALAPEAVSAYRNKETLSFRVKDGNVILTFNSEEEGGDPSDEEGRLASLIPIRTGLAQGDMRALYLGWLAAIPSNELDDDAVEPPVPAGLNELSASLQALADFLRVDTDLLHVAAQASAPLAPLVAADEAAAWVAALPPAGKDQILTRLIVEPDNRALAMQLFQSFRKASDANRSKPASAPRRTAGVLWQAAEARAAQRTAAAARKAALEKTKREQAEAEARARHLDSLAGQEAKLWSEIDRLVATRLPVSYDQAVHHLVDLRDLAARGGEAATAEFAARLENFRAAHARKPSLLARVVRVVSNVARVS